MIPLSENESTVFTKSILGDLLLGAIIGSLYYHFIWDIFTEESSRIRSIELDLILILILTILLLIIYLLFTYFSSKYYRKILETIINVESEFGIITQSSFFIKDILMSSFLSIRKEYEVFRKYLKDNYIFCVPKKYQQTAIKSILSSENDFFIALRKPSNLIINEIWEKIDSNKYKFILSEETITYLTENSKLDSLINQNNIIWREGTSHLDNIIIAYEKNHETDVPIRSLKFEVNSELIIETEYIITEHQSLLFWFNDFNSNFEQLTNDLLSPIQNCEGVEILKTSIINIYEHHSDLREWLGNQLIEKSEKREIIRAKDIIKSSDSASNDIKLFIENLSDE